MREIREDSEASISNTPQSLASTALREPRIKEPKLHPLYRCLPGSPAVHSPDTDDYALVKEAILTKFNISAHLYIHITECWLNLKEKDNRFHWIFLVIST